jgi:glutaredoxin-related protein
MAAEGDHFRAGAGRDQGAVLLPGGMEPSTLSADKVSPEARDLVAAFHRSVVDQVASTVARDHVVVVGMAQNPFVKKARQLLDREGVKFTYLEDGSYLSAWKERLAIKIWARFPTFPMVFVDGTLVGGHAELVKLQAAGKLKNP